MRKLVLIVVLAAATATVSCGGGSGSSSSNSSGVTNSPSASVAGQKQTRIHFTKNYRKGTGPGQYNTDCIGIVTTEMIHAAKQDKIMWHINVGNGENDDDKCEGLVMADVNLRFDSDVMGSAAMKKLTATGAVIQGTVSNVDSEINKVNKYRVYIGNDVAGPDPEIDVDCGGCGPGPGGPTE